MPPHAAPARQGAMRPVEPMTRSQRPKPRTSARSRARRDEPTAVRPQLETVGLGPSDEATRVESAEDGATAFLRVIRGAHLDEEAKVGGGVALIGRSRKCALRLTEALGVSREHARVSFDGEHYYVEDLESRNGTRVNGKRIKRHRLRDGDVIQISKEKIQFIASAHADARPVHTDATAVIDGPLELGEVPSSSGVFAPSPEREVSARLSVDDDAREPPTPLTRKAGAPVPTGRSRPQPPPPPPGVPENATVPPPLHTAPYPYAQPKRRPAWIAYAASVSIALLLAWGVFTLITRTTGRAVDMDAQAATAAPPEPDTQPDTQPTAPSPNAAKPGAPSTPSANTAKPDAQPTAPGANTAKPDAQPAAAKPDTQPTAPAPVPPAEPVALGSSAGGTVTAVLVNVGDAVQKGQLIARVKGGSAVTARKIKALEREVRMFEQAVAGGNARAKADLADTKKQLARYQARVREVPVKASHAGTVSSVNAKVGRGIRRGAPIVHVTPAP